MEFIQNLARIHHLDIMVKKLKEGVRAYLMGDVVYLDESMPPERRNFAFCHELAHKILNHPEEDILSEEMEDEANQLAVQLLLRPEAFRNDAVTYPLDRLKELYPHASWEVIARARLSWVPALLTIFDNGRQVLRFAPDGFQYPSGPMPLELKVLSGCMATRAHLAMQEGNVRTQGYFVDTGQGFLRVLLWTEFDESG